MSVSQMKEEARMGTNKLARSGGIARIIRRLRSKSCGSG
jgi:hypothetical protein